VELEDSSGISRSFQEFPGISWNFLEVTLPQSDKDLQQQKLFHTKRYEKQQFDPTRVKE